MTHDCLDCIYHGPVVLGKLRCHDSPAQEIEPDLTTGGYPYAEECPNFEDKDGNRNAGPKPCPFCGTERLVMVSGSGGAKIKCCVCNVVLVAGKESEAIAKWNRRA